MRLRTGLHLLKIPLKDIYAIELSRGELGMPAWSNDSLKIRYHRNRVVGDHVVISPLDKTAFLAELELRAPGLQSAIAGNRRPAAAL